MAYFRKRVRNQERVTRLTSSTPALPLGLSGCLLVDGVAPLPLVEPPPPPTPALRNRVLTKPSSEEKSEELLDDDGDAAEAPDAEFDDAVEREKSAGRRLEASWHSTACSTRTPTT